MKDPLFEFSDGYGVMRTIRLILFIQIIAICLDNPSTQYSILYRITCRGVLFYAIRFYSRPFIDVLYLIQVYCDIAVNFYHNNSSVITIYQLNFHHHHHSYHHVHSHSIFFKLS
jgi:hypothetical protein